MIYIDFIGGSHGNYLEYVCNVILAQVSVDGLPFNQLGAAHKKLYLAPISFQADHYFKKNNTKTEIVNSKIISIQITVDDLLPFAMVSLLRAGDYNLDNDQLDVNTYHKFNNPDYRDQLETIINSFFRNQIEKSYAAVKDPAWPEVNSIADFKNLPDYIREECLTQHNLKLLELSAESPDCPRYILREFFKIAFKSPEQCGLMLQQKKMQYNSTNDVYIFPYAAFYNSERFAEEIAGIARWSNFTFDHYHKIEPLHAEFLSRQRYKYAKIKCNDIINNIINHCPNLTLPKLDLIEESYISAYLESHYLKIIPTDQSDWFRSYEEIWKYFE